MRRPDTGQNAQHMPHNHRFWVPAHEAGHLTVALSVGILPDYSIIDYKADGCVDVRNSFLADAPTNASQQRDIVTAGLAAEAIIYREETSDIPQRDFLSAAFERSQADRAQFLENYDLEGLNISTVGAENELMLFVSLQHARPIIKNNLSVFTRTRQHLAEHGFIGRSSLRRIQSGDATGEISVRDDYQQLRSQS